MPKFSLNVEVMESCWKLNGNFLVRKTKTFWKNFLRNNRYYSTILMSTGDPPQPPINLKQVLTTLARAGIKAVPYGSSTLELFDGFIGPSSKARASAWCEEVNSRLESLGRRPEISIEELQSNQEFVDCLLKATR